MLHTEKKQASGRILRLCICTTGQPFIISLYMILKFPFSPAELTSRPRKSMKCSTGLLPLACTLITSNIGSYQLSLAFFTDGSVRWILNTLDNLSTATIISLLLSLSCSTTTSSRFNFKQVLLPFPMECFFVSFTNLS